jgi:hypothetical protein
VSVLPVYVGGEVYGMRRPESGPIRYFWWCDGCRTRHDYADRRPAVRVNSGVRCLEAAQQPTRPRRWWFVYQGKESGPYRTKPEAAMALMRLREAHP